MRKLLAAAACVLTLAVPGVSSAQQAGWQYAYVDGVATATQSDDRGRVTATLTCRPPTGDIVITDYTLARAARLRAQLGQIANRDTAIFGDDDGRGLGDLRRYLGHDGLLIFEIECHG